LNAAAVAALRTRKVRLPPVHAATDQPSATTPAAARRAAGILLGVAVAAWLLLVLEYQYAVEWLRGREVVLDALFLTGIGGTVVARAIERRGTAAVVRSLARLSFALVVTVIALVAAEYGMRVGYRQARSSRNVGDYIGRRAAAAPQRINHLGFREREIPPKSDKYRIVIIGDSFTWGNGLEEPERTSNVLGEALGPKYEVFNFGLPGDNMPEHLAVLARALTVKPDYVLLQLYINDFETREMQRPRPHPLLPASLDRRLGESSILYDQMRDQWVHLQEVLGLTESYVSYMAKNLRDPNAPNAREAYGNLRQFFENARAAGVPTGAFLFPATDALGAYGRSYPFGYLHEGVKRVCEEEHVRCLDLFPTFSTFADPRSLWVSPFDAHPNAMAAKRAAFAVLQMFGGDWH
jgi:lysophospholipase L1-like esterase